MPAAKRKATKKTTRKPAAKKATKKVTKKVAKKTTKTKAKTTAKKAKVAVAKPIREKQTKAQIIADIADETGADKKTVREFFAALKSQVERHVKKSGSGEMTIPELGIKVKRVKKPATKARKGRNPFTGEEIMIKAKPARTVVKATALKACKELAS